MRSINYPARSGRGSPLELSTPPMHGNSPTTVMLRCRSVPTVSFGRNDERTDCYHFATQLGGISRNGAGSIGSAVPCKPYNLGLSTTERDGNGHRQPHFECGAFDHSATSPGALAGGLIRPRSGRVLGEDGGADKALPAGICRSGANLPSGKSGAARRDKPWRPRVASLKFWPEVRLRWPV